ncbi:hypothetical protein QNO07_03680 [Streptomyces sp. 549]|uniref:hypothetical protein n=1 Tax=Streptomyces sp. 549 TaxID=3049076 RepID=UPI0024C35F98|nr:hypothetical protein [Streptomyces sp. 549]MDK1472535.1 hypothetical protein [Streptomyces sp. 549]
MRRKTSATLVAATALIPLVLSNGSAQAKSTDEVKASSLSCHLTSKHTYTDASGRVLLSYTKVKLWETNGTTVKRKKISYGGNVTPLGKMQGWTYSRTTGVVDEYRQWFGVRNARHYSAATGNFVNSLGKKPVKLEARQIVRANGTWETNGPSYGECS